MDLIYASTRNAEEKVTASQAILKGLAGEGGLFVPTAIPALDIDLDDLAKMTYQETAYAVMKQIFDRFYRRRIKKLHQCRI